MKSIFSFPVQKGFVSVIVINWNGKDFIFSCLDSLFSQRYPSLEVILVDNGSTDGSLQEIGKKYTHSLKVISNVRNLGFAEGVNVGIRNSKGEFIALLNSDAVARDNWIEELVREINRSSSFGMCASKIYLANRENILDNTGEVISRDGLGKGRGRLEKDEGQYDTQKEALCPSGCAAFYRREMFENIGLFDKQFFMYAEDIDLGLRARLCGYRCSYAPSAVVLHKFSSSSGAVSSMKAYYVERNRLWVILKCFPLRHLLVSPYYTVQRYFYHFWGLFYEKGPASHYVKKYSWFNLFLILIKAYLSTLVFLPYLIFQRLKLKQKSKFTAGQFEKLLAAYGISSKDIALNELI